MRPVKMLAAAIGLVALAGAMALLPDFVRYMKIRSM